MYEICVIIIQIYNIFHFENSFVNMFIKMPTNHGITPIIAIVFDEKLPEIITDVATSIPSKPMARYTPEIETMFCVNFEPR